MADPFADLFTSSSSDIFRSRTHNRSASSSLHATRGNTPVPPDTPSQSSTGTPTRGSTPLGQAVPGSATGAGAGREEDEFGTFVSVPATLDPLHQPEPFSPLASAPLSKTDPFGALLSPTSLVDHPFVVEARQRHEKNERRVLDELLQHEDDPLYWVKAKDKSEEEMTGNDLLVDLLGKEEGPPSPPPSPRAGVRPMDKPKPKPSDEHSTPKAFTAPVPIPKPMLPGPTPPQVRPRHIHKSSNSFTATLPRRISSFLGASLPSPPSASEHLDEPPSPTFTRTNMPSSVDALNSSTQQHHRTSGSASGSASSTPASQPQRPLPTVSHTNPFSSSSIPYIPPSGAPGFVPSPNRSPSPLPPEGMNLGPLILAGRKASTTPVLTNDLAQVIRVNLPPLSRLSKTWTLLYSMDQHGISLSTFYKQSHPSSVGTSKGAIVVVQDTDEGIFGAWVGDGIRLGENSHYGGGDSFLWKETPPLHVSFSPGVKLFKWTGRNDYVVLCEHQFISFGGGEDGKTGLYLDHSLLSGTTARCRTFDNEILCRSDSAISRMGTAEFEVLGIEVWGMGS